MTPSKEIPLTKLPLNSEGRVVTVLENSQTGRRLKNLGFIKGTVVKLYRQASFGGPLLIGLRGCRICLRTKEAKLILVESVAQ